MGVLLLFNKAEEIRVEDVKRGTGLKDFDLKRTLQSLVESRIILKKGAEKEKAPQVLARPLFLFRRHTSQLYHSW
jgi:hypothetical protein